MSQKRNLKYTLPGGESYIQANVRGQFWGRYANYNPGASIAGENVQNYTDFSLRRFRIGVQSKLGKHFYIFTQIGGNNINQNTLNDFKVQLLDLYGEYTFSPSFSLGVGKSSWGTSNRISSFSNGNMLNTDALIFSLFTLNKQDHYGRNLGIYAKGQLGKVDYRLAISSPPLAKTKLSHKVDFSPFAPRKRYSGYLKYEFWENESNTNAFSGSAGTYLGEKNIFNIGIGGSYQSKMMARQREEETEYYDFKNFSADIFIEKKLSDDGAAVTAYLGYFYTDYGPDYLRNVGTNNIADAIGTSLNGKGLDLPTMGTGNTLFLSAGYLLPKFLGKEYRIQPNVALRYADYVALKNPIAIYDAGVNIYLNGQASKITLGYQNRPIIEPQTLKTTQREGAAVLQYQFEIK